MSHQELPREAWLVSETKFYELYTPEEKAKLYSAIGYEENEADPTLPVEVSPTVVDRFSVALFSTLQQTHCALASCDCR